MALAFEPTLYNQLPSLDEARQSRDAPFVDAVINGPIRDLFLKYAADAVFCLYLQHRHHKVASGEAIVKVEGTAHLMNGEEMKDIEKFGNKIVPTTWMTSNGTVVPMEFASTPSARVHTPLEARTPSPEFVAEFVALLHENKCEDMFGIDTLAASAWSELKIGDASVVVPCDNSTEHDEAKYIPVAFAFTQDEPTFVVHGKCGTDHKHTGKPQ